ncbi:MAG: DUF4406 domain-containing protein [Oscillospiraceae bacterium]
MKIYIAGRITGDADFREKFEQASNSVIALGHTPLNPARLPEGLSLADYMRICWSMIDVADKVLFLPDYCESKGAMLEYNYCVYIGKAFCFGLENI